MKPFFLVLAFLVGHYQLHAQVIESEKVQSFPSGMSNPNLVNAYYDNQNKSLNLRFFRDNSVNQSEWADITYDSLNNQVDYQNEQIDYNKDAYLAKLFPGYQGKEFSASGYDIIENYKGLSFGSGEIYARKVNYHYKWNWFFRDYTIQSNVQDEVMLPKTDGKKYFPVRNWFNSATGDLFVLVAYQKKGAVTMLEADNQVITSNYKLFKVSADFQITEIASLDFEHSQFVHFNAIVPINRSYTAINPNAYPTDLRYGKLMLIFSPARGLLVPNQDPNKGNYTFMCMNNDGQIEFKTNASMPNPRWAIEGVINCGDDFYFWGPSQHNISRWKHFQLLKLNSGRVSYITSNYWKDFNKTIVKSSNQLLKHGYHGKLFIPLVAAVSDNGEFFYGGQNYRISNNQTSYKSLLVSHFNSEGKVIASYGFRPERMLIAKHHPASLNLYFGNSTGKLYVEIGNYHSGVTWYQGSLADRLLFGQSPYTVQFNYYPRIIGIDLTSKTVINSVTLGIDTKGRHRYFINGNSPVIRIPEENKLIYIGNDYFSNKLWIAKIRLE